MGICPGLGCGHEVERPEPLLEAVTREEDVNSAQQSRLTLLGQRRGPSAKEGKTAISP